MESVLDLIRIAKNNDRETVFNSYVDSSNIADKIMDSLVKFYNVNKEGFPLDDNKDKIGIISNCMALSSFIELKKMKAKTSQHNPIFRLLIEKVFADIYKDGTNPVFTAEPYSKVKITSYTETISKVLITIVDLRDYFLNKYANEKYQIGDGYQFLDTFDQPINIKGKAYKDFLSILKPIEDLIKSCLDVLIDSAIVVEEQEQKPFYLLGNKKIVSYSGKEEAVKYKGWSFKTPTIEENNRFEPSIYFTYHVTNAFLNLFNSLNPQFVLNYDLKSKEEKEEYINGIVNQSEFASVKFHQDEIFFKKYFDKIDLFRNQTISAGRYFHTTIYANHVDFGYDFINNDLSGVSVANVDNSSYSTSALINTLLVLSIYINCGIDDDFNSIGEKDYLYGQIQYSLNNIKKVYDSKSRKNFEDSVNSYKLGEERIPSSATELFKIIRMDTSNTSMYDLVPLYCNTYSIIFDYLIRYPQKEMVNNLEWVLENKASDEWYWDKRGFNINNNLYYVFYIENFYRYFDQYEKDFLEKQGLISRYKKQIEDEVVKAKKQEQLANVKINDLQVKLETKRSNLDLEVENLVNQVLDSKIDSLFGSYFDKLLRNIETFKAESYLKTEDEIADYVMDTLNANPSIKMLLYVNALSNIKVNLDEMTSIINEDDRVSKVESLLRNYIINNINK